MPKELNPLLMEVVDQVSRFDQAPERLELDEDEEREIPELSKDEVIDLCEAFVTRVIRDAQAHDVLAVAMIPVAKEVNAFCGALGLQLSEDMERDLKGGALRFVQTSVDTLARSVLLEYALFQVENHPSGI